MAKRSEIVSDFLDFIKASKEEYAGSIERLKEYDKQTQDALHDLELSARSDEVILAVAKQLQAIRQERRIDKDCMEETVKVVDMMSEPEMNRCMNRLSKLLGEIRKAEKYHENRIYHYKAVAVNE